MHLNELCLFSLLLGRVSSRKLYQGGSSVIIMKGGHDQMKSRCGFYSKLEYCEGMVEEFGGEVGELGGEASPPPPPPPHSPQ